MPDVLREKTFTGAHSKVGRKEESRNNFVRENVFEATEKQNNKSFISYFLSTDLGTGPRGVFHNRYKWPLNSRRESASTPNSPSATKSQHSRCAEHRSITMMNV